jgi:oxygen-independent coproporphyrinogen-3 oxidase
MCTFCGCNKRITRNHQVEIPYIKSVIREWQMYVDLMDERPVIREIHLGGGTPTFFSPENLQLLIHGLMNRAKKPVQAELSFEGHPNNTTEAHLKALAESGFTRVSFGVQDYNPKVQRAINRIQSFERVQDVTNQARLAGFNSVGHDIIFGLPFQTTDHIRYTIDRTVELLPDRIAFYSYAHVPWMKGNGQRGFSEEDLPTADQKREQYETGKELLLKAGYVEIGMDHFALPSDKLYKAYKNGTLHRNFMGYTPATTQLMIGLGVSAISDSWYGFAQNVKGVEEYQGLVTEGILPVHRGHILSDEDLVIRRHILNLMCRFETSWDEQELNFGELHNVLDRLKEIEADGLLELGREKLRVRKEGQAFIRNICMAFDLRLQRSKPETQLFSMTI